MRCSRCGRVHSGVCGIPPIGVRIGIGGTGIQRVRQPSSNFPIHTKPKEAAKPFTKHGLENLLAWGLREEQKVKDLLKSIPGDMPEYDELIKKLDQLAYILAQIRRQLYYQRQGGRKPRGSRVEASLHPSP